MKGIWNNCEFLTGQAGKAGRQACRSGQSMVEWLLIAGIVTFFLWPFMQLWSAKAMPLMPSDAHQKAATALETLMAKAQARPFHDLPYESAFTPISGGEDLGLEGRIQIMPHPDFTGLTLVRAQVRWGMFFFRKMLVLEAVESQSRP